MNSSIYYIMCVSFILVCIESIVVAAKQQLVFFFWFFF